MRRVATRLASQYGMLGALILLVLLFSALTLRDQHPTGEAGARGLARLVSEEGGSVPVLIIARGGPDDVRFARALEEDLRGRGVAIAGVSAGDPASLRSDLAAIAAAAPQGLCVATLEGSAPVVRGLLADFPSLARVPVFTPPSYRWPTFLLPDNLRNVANQIAVIAILAVGMTMVIVAGGIDLSVGSLIALSAVVATGLIGRLGGESAGGAALFLGGAAAIVVCGVAGLLSGFTITRFGVPPFIATLGMMQVASGLAYILSHGVPIYHLPDSFVVLGRGADGLIGVPYGVWLMLALYVLAHLVMTRTVLGRAIYAVGGNAEAARLAGVRVRAVTLFVYITAGALAGLGGVVTASQLKSGAPTYGLMYELYVIASVVVGGTSLSGGEGRIFGTLIGAFIIAVIQNGMNLTNVESYTQKVVLGLVILGAVLLDRFRHVGGAGALLRRRPRAARRGAEGT